MKKLLFIPCAAAAVLGASAQVQLNVADLTTVTRARNEIEMKRSNIISTMSAADASDALNPEVSVMVRVKDADVVAELEALGLKVDRQVGGTIFATVPLDCIEAVAATDGVTSLDLSRKKRLLNDVARAEANVDKVHAGEALSQPYLGDGVVVGLFDGGLDPSHINFLNADGSPRAKRVWKYSADYYGRTSETEYATPSKISGFTTDDSQETHGTHVLGIMAGSFADPDGNVDYRGVAPKADIVISCGDATDEAIIAGVQHMADYAAEEGKPCVINLSLGVNYGPHDGTDAFGDALNKIASDPNVHIFVASGNEGGYPCSVIGTIGDNAPVQTVVGPGKYTTDTYYGIGSLGQAYGDIDVWSEDDTPIKLYLDIIDKLFPDQPLYSIEVPLNGTTFIANGTSYRQEVDGTPDKNVTEFNNVYNDSFIYAQLSKDANNNRYHGELKLLLKARSRTLQSTTFVAVRVEGQSGKKVYIYDYTPSYELLAFSSMNLDGFLEGNAAGSINDMACGQDVVSVGSYSTRNVAGSPYANQTIGKISSFSSWGTVVDGRSLPEIVAPGSVLISSMSKFYKNYMYMYGDIISYTYTDSGSGTAYYWMPMAGTSMATPFVSGVAALWLSANPDLTTAQIVEIAKQTAQEPSSLTDAWGSSNGKIDAWEGIKKALETSDIKSVTNDEVTGDAVLIQAKGDNLYDLFAVGEDSFTVGLYNMQGQLVRSAVSNGSDMIFDVNGVQPGVYVLSVQGAKIVKSVKITVK